MSKEAATSQKLELHESLDLDPTPIEGADGRHIVGVTLIRSGKSKMGNHYPAHVLRESAPLFEGARAFIDHPKPGDLPERSVRDLAGYYRNVAMDGDALRGELHLIPGQEWLWHLMQEAQKHPGLAGLSIDAWGDGTKTGRDQYVESIQVVNSCDIVTRPSAGGGIDRIIASDRSPKDHPMEQEAKPEEQQSPPPAAPADTKLTEAAPEATSKDDAPTLAKLVEQLTQDRERMQSELRAVQDLLSPGQSHQPASDLAGVTSLVESMKRDFETQRCTAELGAKLTEAKLPPPVADKIRKNFSSRIFESASLDLAIQEEKSMLAALSSAGQISGMGYEKPIHLGMTQLDQLQAAMDALFDIYESDLAKTVPRLSGIREAFRIATGVDIGSIGGVDRRLTESLTDQLIAKAQRGHFSESEVLLREADVQTSTFSYLLGTSMNKRLLSDYQAWPSEWQKFTTIVGVKDFKQQDRIRLGAFGSLSTVAEDAAYTTLTLADTRATYTPTKRGNLVQITRETIVNDDLYAIKQIPQKLAVAAAFTLAEFVYNLLAPNFGNIYDAHPLFDSVNHLNSAVVAANLNTKNSGGALTSANLQTGVIAMRKQQNLASKPIGLKPRYVVTVPDLEFTAMTVLKSAGLPGGNNNDINPMMGYAEPIIAPQLSNTAAGPANTTTLWIAIADPAVIDTLEVGFVGGQQNPVLLIQDMPLYGLNFTQDVISYKVRHEYGGAVVDYRGFYLGNN